MTTETPAWSTLPAYVAANAGRGAKSLRNFDYKGYTARVEEIARTFDREALESTIASAAAGLAAWTERNMKWNAGQDLMDAQRGVYNAQAAVSLLREALAKLS